MYVRTFASYYKRNPVNPVLMYLMRLSRSGFISILVNAFVQVQETWVLYIMIIIIIIDDDRSTVGVKYRFQRRRLFIIHGSFICDGEKYGITLGDDTSALRVCVSTLPWVLQSFILARQMARAHVNHFRYDYYWPRH